MHSAEHYKIAQDLLNQAAGQSRPENTVALAMAHFRAAEIAFQVEARGFGHERAGEWMAVLLEQPRKPRGSF